jgi:hypothetical protein
VCRRAASYLLWSLVLHGAALLGLPGVKMARQLQPIAITYSTKSNQKPRHKKLNLSSKAEPRIGSAAYLRQNRALGTTLAAQYFLERLKAHIEPSWHMFVQRSGTTPVTCSTIVYIDAYPNGTAKLVYTVANSCPEALRNAAMEAIKYCNLIPVPKILLASSGLFELEWTFTLTAKD